MPTTYESHMEADHWCDNNQSQAVGDRSAVRSEVTQAGFVTWHFMAMQGNQNLQHYKEIEYCPFCGDQLPSNATPLSFVPAAAAPQGGQP